jgi:hypothetical protein
VGRLSKRVIEICICMNALFFNFAKRLAKMTVIRVSLLKPLFV